MNAPWASEPAAVLAQFKVAPDLGLTQAQVLTARAQFGRNELQRAARRSVWLILADQLRSLVVALLAGATVLAFMMGDVAEAIAIVIVIALNTALGFFTELKAVRSMEALRELGRVSALVRRAGKVQQLPSEQLVPGDIVVLEAGDIVPADLRVFKASRLGADESALTGESVPVGKGTAAVADSAPIAEREGVLHRATVVTRGAGEGVVFATGLATQVGHIATLVEHAEAEQTPLEKRLTRLGRQLVWVTLVIAILMVVMSVVSGRDVLLAVETSIALAVAAIPEGLPIVATLALARGMWRMAERNAVISRLSAVETLGATSVILTDKTGTLTENEMAASQLLVPDSQASDGRASVEAATLSPETPVDNAALEQLLRVVALCNNAHLDGQATGDPTEVALLRLAVRAGFDRDTLLAGAPERRQEAFDPDRQMMATLHAVGDDYWVAVKGGPEAVLACCTQLGQSGAPLTESERADWLRLGGELGQAGLRVLAAASKRSSRLSADPYAELTLLGLIGLWDPPRADVAASIRICRRAGVRVVMVTGDHPATASHVARAVDIVDGAHDVIDSRSYSHAHSLAVAEQARLLAANVIARSSPEQKLELIEMHQQGGHIVAMTGDGVNDAPALKKADIGIAMGVRGTAVAKQAAAMVLRDDAFSTIVEAIRYGRAIYANIRRFVLYLMSCNLSEILVVGIATVSGAPLPLTPLQILFLNLVTDVFPALALGVNQAEPQVMERPPRPASEPILTQRHWVQIVLHGSVIALTVLLAMWLASTRFGLSGSALTTVTFCTLALAQIWHVLNVRDRAAGWQAATLRNPWVWSAMVLCLVLIALALSLPAVAVALSLQWLAGEVMLMTVALSLLPLLFGGAVNWLAAKLTASPAFQGSRQQRT